MNQISKCKDNQVPHHLCVVIMYPTNKHFRLCLMLILSMSACMFFVSIPYSWMNLTSVIAIYKNIGMDNEQSRYNNYAIQKTKQIQNQFWKTMNNTINKSENVRYLNNIAYNSMNEL
eukprot:179426_1